MLAGEYVVLDGAPAVLVAIDRRARAAIPAGTGGPAPAEGGLLDAVCATLGVSPPRGIVLDSRAFGADAAGSRVKLGLGSSAALAVALCRLLLPAATLPRDVFEAAFAAHRRFQGGVGSGADVAASLAGGVLSFRMAGKEAGAGSVRLAWPAGLAWAAWWSGVPASTPERVARFTASGPSPERERLAAAADAVTLAWQGGAETLLAEFVRYVEVLQAFDRRHGLGIFAAGHDELAAAARRCGALYKPCGAGGGDVGIALATTPAALRRFGRAAAERGFRPLDLAVDERGAVLDEPRE
ncbi:MAG TPA: hypothetical protein VFY03_01000 [Woeseiaceae bacterium]|nr:hypothetical protein [Woeseiaceae bacterium]